ncbi:MAG TPA: GAF domain-containing protein [Terracidiphilus sp.]|nr:GAF domain-containing protein [Terracidiphilus sp.]
MDDVNYAISSVNEAVAETAAQLLVATEVASRAAVIASAIATLVPDSACLVHRYRPENDPQPWSITGAAGDISLAAQEHAGAWLFEMPELFPAPGQIFESDRISREDYAHFNVAHSVCAIAYLPVENDGQLVAVLEIAVFSGDISPERLDELDPFVGLTASALLSSEALERQRQKLLDSVHRMSEFYDLEKSLNATLEMDALIAMVPAKVAAMLPCQSMHLWLFDGPILRLVSREGEDDSIAVGSTEAPGEGYVADMAEEGEPLIIADPEDERLRARNARRPGDSQLPLVQNALVVPLLQDEAEIGVLEAINRTDRSFDDDDEFLLVSIAETVSNALKNASLMMAERKLEILKVLVQVSSEITSTLRLDRLLQIIVNSPQSVLPYEMCAIALDNRGRLQLKAVSGMASLPMGDIAVERVEQLLRWVSLQPDALHLGWREGSDPDEASELPPEILKHFQETGYRALYSLPLSDDQGRVGALVYESSDPEFLGTAQIEMIKVLAGQATVALRNALLYREVPLINLLEPLMQKRAALLRTSRTRRLVYAATAAAIGLFLVFCPLPMRLEGDAVVEPQHLATVAAPMEANVDRVYAHEGQRVVAGQLLGALTDWQWRANLDAAEAKYQQALLTMEDDLAHGSARAGADRANVSYLRSEALQARARLDSAQLRSPIDGIVVTPELENAAGEHLDAGAQFAQVLDLHSAVVRIAVSQRDASLLRSGQPAAIKLDSYPQRTWHDAVTVLSPQAVAGDGERTVSVEVLLPNADAALRAGMSGKGKISIGWRPAGYVLLRRPALWLWQTMWNWIGW